MMGTGASFKSKEEAIAAGKTEAEIAEYMKNNPSLITPVAAPAAAAATAMATVIAKSARPTTTAAAVAQWRQCLRRQRRWQR